MNKVQKDQFDAWIIDIMVHKKGMLLWLKRRNGEVVPILYQYYPSFYIVPRNQESKDKNDSNVRYYNLLSSMRSHPMIRSVTTCRRRVKAEDSHFSQVIRIQVESPFKFKQIVRQVQDLEQFDLYNVDIPLSQMFFYETGLFPFAFCSFKFYKNKTGLVIESVLLKDSNESLLYELPPLKVIWLEIEADQHGLRKKSTDRLKCFNLVVDPCSINIPLNQLFLQSEISKDKHGALQITVREDNEKKLLYALQNAIKKIDPDVIFTSNGDSDLFPYLLSRVSYLHLENYFSLLYF